MYVIGCAEPFKDQAELARLLRNFFWITYRHEMYPLRGTALTSDSGWGCMIRSGQMLTATAIASLLQGEDWARQGLDREMRRFVVSLFLDTPSTALSLHNIVRAGESLGRRVGEWHAPSVTANAITRHDVLSGLYVVHSALINSQLTLGLRSYCTLDMTVDLEETRRLLEGSKLLLWIPMRLGVDSLSGSYVTPLKQLFATRFCVGVAGGRPNSALYFIGFENDDLLYLDPHVSRTAVRAFTPEQIDEEDLESYSCGEVRRVGILSIDPCFVVGFVIPDLEAFEGWRREMAEIRTNTGDSIVSFGSPTAFRESTSFIDLEDDLVAVDFENI